MERHLRGRRLTVQRALTDSVEQRWPTSRPGSAFRQRRCHPAAPEYRRLRAEPERPGPRQGAYSSAPAAVMRPRCPRVAAAAARYRRRAGRAGPPPRAPGAPPGRPTTCAGRGATTDPSAGAVPGRTSGRCSPSRCSGRAPRRAACRAVAPPRERVAASRPATWRVLMPAACSISSRWRCGCSSGAADNGSGDSSANGSSWDDSGMREAALGDSDGAATGKGACAGRIVGGTCSGAGPSSDDDAAGTGAHRGARNGESCQPAAVGWIADMN